MKHAQTILVTDSETNNSNALGIVRRNAGSRMSERYFAMNSKLMQDSDMVISLKTFQKQDPDMAMSFDEASQESASKQLIIYLGEDQS